MAVSVTFNYRFQLIFISAICCLHEEVNGDADWSSDAQVFDFIVVGGGTAGCALAARLSENLTHSVLVLESGGFPDMWLDVPAVSFSYWNEDNKKLYESIPQQNLGDLNKIVSYPVGVMLGGCSQHNGNLINRGSPHDYDNWARVTGDSSWSYSNLLKYFKKMENYAGEFLNNSHQHGFGGPITVSQPKFAPGLSLWLETGKILNYSVSDPNGLQKLGFAPTEFSKHQGRKVSSFTGYIKPIVGNRSNLKIVTNADVRRILFEGNTAIGVRYTNKKLSHSVEVLARKEIIISAGVMSSPAILQRSGIGPENVLESAGIQPVKILPVGKNLQDHLLIEFGISLNNTSVVTIGSRDLTMESFNYFEKFGDGAYAGHNGVVGQAFLASSKSIKNGIRNWPDIHLVPFFSAIEPGASKKINEYQHRMIRYPQRDTIKKSSDIVFMSTLAMLSRPKSRGRVTLNSTDIDADPLINFAYLSHPDDLEASLEMVRYVEEIFEGTETFKKVGAKILRLPIPECDNEFSYRSDDYWRCYIRQMSSSGFHAAGTCKMGRGVGDPEAVVDSKLRVIGIDNLRVVDNSIMPDVTNTNTQVPAYVIAEKAANMIRQKWS